MNSISLVVLLCYIGLSFNHEGHHETHGSMDDFKFRYSREANVEKADELQKDSHNHGHDHHGHSHDHHGHSNDHHGHSHDHHGHSHDHHGHSHDHHGHSHDHHGHSHDHHGHSHDHHGHSHDHHGHSHGTGQVYAKDTQELWLYALGSTTLISIAPFFILFFIPLQSNDAEYQPLLKVLLGFASGGLLGDAFLHLIPHAVEYQNHQGHSHGHHHHGHSHGDHAHVHDLTIGLCVIGGFAMFLLIEKFVRICNGGESGHGHSHGHSGGSPKQKSDDKKCKENEKSKLKTDTTENTYGDKTKIAKDSKPTKEECDDNNDVKVTGYLNLVADFTHNFTDGLTIATSYLLGTQIGIVSTITILFHEIPHEIGDFSILIQSGFGKRKAIMMQLLTAVGAISGTLVGLLAQGLGDEFINLYILPFTAGGFIYIATVSVIPDLLEETKLVPTIIQLISMFLGVYLMVVISWYE